MSISHFIAAPLLPVLLTVSAACSGAETALFSLSHADKVRLRKQSTIAADCVQALLENPRALLITVLLANVFVNTAYFAVAVKVGQGFEDPAKSAVFGAIVLFCMILFGELVPKSLAAAHRVVICRVVAAPALVVFRAMWPLRFAAEHFVIAPMARLARPAGAEEHSTVTSGELAAMLKAGVSQGVLHKNEERLMGDVLRLRSVRVREVMTPRVEMEWVKDTSSVQEVLELAKQTRRMKLPVCHGSIDDGVSGVIRVQRLLPELNKQKIQARHAIGAFVDAAIFIPERSRLDQLLERLRASGTDLAICVDEHGTVTGVASTEDIMRELFTSDSAKEAAMDVELRMKTEGVWEAPSRLSVRDWREFFTGVGQLDERVSTIGGLVLSALGRPANPGDAVTFGNVKLTVLEVDGRTIDRVEIALIAAEARTS